MAAGDITASKILQIKLKAEQMWKDSRLEAEYKTNADAAVAVLKNQTARLNELTDPDRDNSVSVTWMNPCGVEVEDCDNSCTIGGDEPETKAQVYELDLCKATQFSINLEKLRTNTYSEVEFTARKMMLAVKALDEYWAQQVLVKLKAFSGYNVFPGTFNYAGNTTTIPAAQYNEQIWAYLIQAGILNKMPSTYMIDNGSLFLPLTNAGLNAPNAEGAGAGARAALLNGKLTYDMWNFIPAGLTEDTFVISPGAVAFKTKARFSSTPEYLGGTVNQWRYSIKSPTLPGVTYDVISQLSCKPNPTTKQEEIVISYKVITRGGIFKNPDGCPITVGEDTFTPTGVLSFSKGA